MNFFVLSCLLVPLTAITRAQNLNPISPISVAPNSIYDDSSASTTNVTCASSLERINATSFGDVQRWPFIGGTPAIAANGSNSPTCVSCWNMTFEGNFEFIVAINHEVDSFQISQSAFKALVNETENEPSLITANVQLIDNRFCGLL
ncbi:hypothetical protein SCHPADRAFT_463525 [Schizopora paradoxa]|uniref:Cerato-platanin n=1 Tax=Schizopora paradoxa TaxID=27342 RepID=A0A0H2RJ08_9AGAM|nr:hypothetical protein SCHPADRAFT_463525 [Schizopora paradoxa]